MNNHARGEFDCLADVALRLPNQRRNVVAVTEDDFARDFQAVVFAAFEQVLNRDTFKRLDKFACLENSLDDALNNFVVDNQLAVVTEHRPHD